MFFSRVRCVFGVGGADGGGGGGGGGGGVTDRRFVLL